MQMNYTHQLQFLSDEDFRNLALKIFKNQANHNAIYKQWLDLLKIPTNEITDLKDIPFLPIQFFKDHDIKTGKWEYKTVFKSSGTTGTSTSSHFVKDMHHYLTNSKLIFEKLFGQITDWVIIGLLPSYLERPDSSLVAMVNHFIKECKHSEAGFYLYNYNELLKSLKEASVKGKKVMLFGVTFALLELVEKGHKFPPGVHIIETGGMKGRGKELIREELHHKLGQLEPESILSEYGMTELFSQAYMIQNFQFSPPSSMKIFIRDPYDPFEILENGKSGGINIIDLANKDTCSFIATEDIGRKFPDGSFEVLGRLDNAQLRGCNLLVG